MHIEGGNYFDDIRVDIKKAYFLQNENIQKLRKKTVRRNFIINYCYLFVTILLKKLFIYDALVSTGVIGGWFIQFQNYWCEILSGRPISINDFHCLKFNYRVNVQSENNLDWSNNLQHINNWQNYKNIAYTFHYVHKLALNPIRYRRLWKYLKHDMTVLEYGCSLAPMYNTWRTFLNHRKTNWILADIENFPFHYARYIYSQDLEAKTVVIEADNLDAPFSKNSIEYDIVIIQEVYEHLHDPYTVTKNLTVNLKKGGLLIFDYIVSDAQGLDTPAGLSYRRKTLEFIYDHYWILEGKFSLENMNLGLCVARKK